MANILFKLLSVALCASFACADEGTLSLGASKGDTLILVGDLILKAPADRAGFEAGGQVMLGSEVYTIKSVVGDTVTLTTPLTQDYDTGAKVMATSAGGTGTEVVQKATVTTTMTGWDSSASSGSMSLDSSNSGSLHEESSSFDSGSDLSDSASSGSTASGSWGSYLEFWQWLVLAAVLCLCCCGGAGVATLKKKKSKKKKTKPQAPAPIPVSQVEPVPMAAAAVTDPLVMPLQPAALPSYAMAPTYAAGMTYAAPATMSLAYPFADPMMQQGYTPAAPMMQSYAYTPAAPGMESYYAAAMPTAQYAPQYATTGLAQY